MNYTDTNKLIAEFDGWKLSSDGVTYINPQDQDDCWLLQDMLFDDSWDWLMPVIEEIYDRVDKENIEEFYCFKHCIPNRDTTYNAVVEFIEFYNQNQ